MKGRNKLTFQFNNDSLCLNLLLKITYLLCPYRKSASYLGASDGNMLLSFRELFSTEASTILFHLKRKS